MKTTNNTDVGPQSGPKKQKDKLTPPLTMLSIVAGLQASTQLFAHQLNYQASLGEHIGLIYAPWSIVVWVDQWFALNPDIFMAAGSCGVMVTGVGMAGTLCRQNIKNNSSKINSTLHGSAKWASKDNIINAGLLPPKKTLLDIVRSDTPSTSNGVYVGGWQDENGVIYYLRHYGEEHVLTYAPTRSGKGVGLVIPTLLSWCASAVITDLKGELWALTAGWRKHQRQKVLRFEPATRLTIKWNPLSEIRLGTEYEVGDVQNLCTLIVDPDGKGLESHWQKTSFSLLVGVVLHALYKGVEDEIPATLPLVDNILTNPGRDLSELWLEMKTFEHTSEGVHPVVAASAQDMIDRPEDEAGSVLSTAKSYLMLYRDPVVANAVSKSEFSIKDLMNHDDPVSLYIITQPVDKDRLRPLIRIMMNMVIRLLANKMEFKNGRPAPQYKHKLLMMIDEFPSLGKLDVLQESLAFVAGYGIKCYLICQDLNQLKSREKGYGPDETITSNCHVQNAYPPNRIETAEHLSKLTGETTIVKERITTSGGRFSWMHKNVSRGIDEIKRPLLTPDEALRMPGPKKNSAGEIIKAGDMIIYVAGYPAIYGKQILYFQDATFKKRAAISAPEFTDKIHSTFN